MTDDRCVAAPLLEQLHSVPKDAVLRIDTPNALDCMDTRSIPVGRLCHEAADALSDLKTAALLCPSSEIGSSNVLRVVNFLAQIRAERMHLEAYAAANRKD